MAKVTTASSPTIGQKLSGWLMDYGYAAYWMFRAVAGRGKPDLRLHPLTAPRSPVLLIPGVFESWRFMQPVAEHLFRDGRPVHVLDKLGYNTGAIPDMAAIAGDYIEREKLRDLTVIAHSKGGLIAKQVLGQTDALDRIRHVITINTPFSGSRYANLFLLSSVRMFGPSAPIIQALSSETAVNGRISSLYSVFDPHVPETGRLAGARNIVLPTVGHFRPLRPSTPCG
ncbi:esterase/lipase family protein [Microlunatus soli]|uniref:AB hydrolase-1 domain-containing protein n=1 Tax=Microlunatus soli TaxID=630515 RepID=A0A1H1N864_9ACTN|nr:alpha/beta fold hydrolase [Microlunatus soli]SDR95127.1 hypothetical protein SAMN04489812_0417 [Microlunatus soli]